MSNKKACERSAFVVTGAASGIGAATVEALLASGASVLALDMTAVAMGTAEHPPEATLIAAVGDVADPSTLRRAVDEAEREFGRLDGIFNNAGILGPSALVEDYAPDALARVLAVNVVGVFNGMRAALPALRRTGGGVVLNTASTGGLVAAPSQSGYVASKHAVIGLTKSVALEVAGAGIAVNALCPGATDTGMMREVVAGWAVAGLDPDEALAEVTPTRRLATPREVALVASWLLRCAPTYMTGACIPVDGAQTAR